MAKIILSINAGSSSVKVSVYETPPADSKNDPKSLAVVQLDGLTAPPPTLKYTRGGEKIESGKKLEKSDIKSQEDAFKYILEHLENDEHLPQLKSHDDVEYATHRVVHGGDYPRAQVIDRETFHHIEQLSDLAPLHNAPALGIVRAVTTQLPNTRNIAYFDTSFHSTIPAHIFTYPIDPRIASRNQLRKYGFHGLSYSFILRAVSAHLSQPAARTNLIALHLGSGASACCIRAGRSRDTSMGLTPLAGLPGATRSGSVDPSLVFHYTHDAGRLSPLSSREMHITAAEEILNKRSGWAALAGTTDFGKISSRAKAAADGDRSEENDMAKLAFDIFVDRILGFVGAYYVQLQGEVDALVFAGGIGEKGAMLRSAVVGKLDCLGFMLDERANESLDGDKVVQDIGAKDARHRVLVCKTDEQLEMARGVVEDADRFHPSREGKP